MFNKDFYPTDKKRFDILTQGLDFSKYREKCILEPSAGKGDMVKFISQSLSKYDNTKIIALELNPELNTILRSIDYCDVIGTDFLNTKITYRVDLIIMNPPFSDGCKHLLKAWEVLHAGEIRCFLNAETYRNPYTEERKLLKSIIDTHGEIIGIDNYFTETERKTNVDIICIKLVKEEQESFNFDTSNFKAENIKFPDDLSESTDIVINNILKNRELYYLQAIEAFKEAMIACQKFRYMSQGILGDYPSWDKYTKLIWEGDFNNFISRLNSEAWQNVLDSSKFANYLTTKVKEDFTSRFSQQRKVAFTEENMKEMFSILFMNRTSILDSCILEVFDTMTMYYKENRCHIEGWKTNDKYKVNMKVILPRYIKYGQYYNSDDLKRYGDKFSLDYSYYSKLDDIDRALCYITGKQMKSIKTIKNSLSDFFTILGKVRTGDKFNSDCESEFFNIKFFKKGTIHITFKDKLLWQWFNCKACELRGYPLPESKDVYKKVNLILI